MIRRLARKAPALALVVVLLLNASAGLAQEPARSGGATFLPFVAGAPPVATPAAAVVTETTSPQAQAAALAYMTRARIAAAAALPIPVHTGPLPAVDPAAAAAAAAAAATPGFSKPGRPAPNADQVAAAAYAEDWALMALPADDAALEAGLQAEEAAALAASPAAPDGTSQIYTSYIANWLAADQTILPHRWYGRLTFSTPGGTNYCSATVIAGNNIVTAAHCVFDTPTRNAWYTNKVFTPAYRNGSAPYGSFPTTNCTILTQYVNIVGNYNLAVWAPVDVAVCTLGRNSAGQTINTAVGWSGTAWDYAYKRNIVNLGYPLQNYARAWLSWEGAYLRLCLAESDYAYNNVRRMGCNWGGGISGGPWVDSTGLASPTAYGTNGYWPGRASGYVTGVNSGIDGATQNLYAPRFTTANFRALCQVRGC